MKRNELGYVVIECPSCKRETTVTFSVSTIVSYPLMDYDGTDFFGDVGRPLFDPFFAEFEAAYCDACNGEILESDLAECIQHCGETLGDNRT